MQRETQAVMATMLVAAIAETKQRLTRIADELATINGGDAKLAKFAGESNIVDWRWRRAGEGQDQSRLSRL